MPYRFIQTNIAKLPLQFILFFCFIFVPINIEAVSMDRLKLDGYIDLEYTKASNDQGNENGSFDQKHFNLLMEASVNERFTVKGHIEFEHGADTSSDFGKVLVEWAFGEYKVTDYLRFRGGKLLTPYGFYNEIDDATPALLFIEVPHGLYNAYERGGSAMFPKWNTGLNMLGEYFMIGDISVDYSFYIGNGESLPTTNSSQFDDNKNKAIGGRIQVHPNFNTTVGLSIFQGDKAITATNNINHTVLGLSTSFDIGNFNISGEYFFSEIGNVDESAYFILASYSHNHRITPFFIYDYLDPDSTIRNDQWKDIGGGINVKLLEGLFFKLEYHQHIRGDNNSVITNNRNNFNEIKAAITAAF